MLFHSNRGGGYLHLGDKAGICGFAQTDICLVQRHEADSLRIECIASRARLSIVLSARRQDPIIVLGIVLSHRNPAGRDKKDGRGDKGPLRRREPGMGIRESHGGIVH